MTRVGSQRHRKKNIIIIFSCRAYFRLGTSPLETTVIAPLRRHVSYCSTFRGMYDVYDVPSVALFGGESVGCFSAMAFTFVFCYYSGGPTYYRYNRTFCGPHTLYLITVLIIFVTIN